MSFIEYLSKRPYINNFKPVPIYCPEDYSIKVYFEDERCYEIPQGPIALYRSMKDNRIVGCKIYDAYKFLEIATRKHHLKDIGFR